MLVPFGFAKVRKYWTGWVLVAVVILAASVAIAAPVVAIGHLGQHAFDHTSVAHTGLARSLARAIGESTFVVSLVVLGGTCFVWYYLIKSQFSEGSPIHRIALAVARRWWLVAAWFGVVTALFTIWNAPVIILIVVVLIPASADVIYRDVTQGDPIKSNNELVVRWRSAILGLILIACLGISLVLGLGQIADHVIRHLSGILEWAMTILSVGIEVAISGVTLGLTIFTLCRMRDLS